MSQLYAVYILTNFTRTVLYAGVTNDLQRRVVEHKERRSSGSFTARYHVNRLVWYEQTSNINAAIAREKQIKSGSRRRKIALIEAMNLEWLDLPAAP